MQGVGGNKYALGYFGYAYYAANTSKVKAVGIEWSKNPTKGPVLPSKETVIAGTYNPLSRPLFIYVNRKSLAKPEVKEFVDFYLQNVPKLAGDVKYVPLPDTAYQMAQQRLSAMQTGTGFGGIPEVGLHIEELLKRPPKS